MSSPSDDGRSPEARGYAIAMRSTSIALQMVIPIGLGYWIDQSWGTGPWCMVAGVILGFSTSMLELIALAKRSADQTKKP